MRVINNLPMSGMNVRNVREATPAIPLPNPGEGGAVFPGNDMNSVNGETDAELNDTNMNNGMNGNMNMGTDMNAPGAIPVIPLPNPGEGGAVFPGNNTGSNTGSFVPTIPGTIIITYPRPNENCSFCNPGSNRNGKIRFLNAASGYNSFWVYINDKLLVNDFGFADVTEYVDVATGDPVITLMGENGYVYLQQPITVQNGMMATVAIVNTVSGLGLKMITDENCDRTRNASCVRVGNLSYSSGPLNVVIGNRYVTFRNVNSGEVTDFATIWPGEYSYTVSRTNNTMYPIWGSTTLLQSVLYLQQDKNYTIYLFQYNPSADAIKAVIVED